MHPPTSRYDNWLRAVVCVGLGGAIVYAVLRSQPEPVNTIREFVPAVSKCGCGVTCKCCHCVDRELKAIEE